MTRTMPVDPSTRWTKVALTEPSTSGYVHFAVSAAGWPIPLALPSRTRRAVRRRMHVLAAATRARNDVLEATVFTALVRPPGGRDAAADVTYDLVLLVETRTVDAARELLASDLWTQHAQPVVAASRDHLQFVATNARRIAPVDHSRRGVFLFNYFSAPTVEANLHAWQYTAGWFQDQTGLDNSTVLQPVESSDTPFSLVNHCRWDHLVDVMPDLMFKPSFESFVLRVFEDNGVAPRPLLFRISRRR